jgi:hypothetical protein
MRDIEDGITVGDLMEVCAFLQWAAEECRAGRLEPGPHSCRWGALPADVAKAASIFYFRDRTDGKGGWLDN